MARKATALTAHLEYVGLPLQAPTFSDGGVGEGSVHHKKDHKKDDEKDDKGGSSFSIDRMDRVNTIDTINTISTTTRGDVIDLRELLLGPSLASEFSKEVLDRGVQVVSDHIRRSYPIDSTDRKAIEIDLLYIASLDATTRQTAECKRAFVLFALHTDPEVAEHFEADTCRDLQTRILPILVPLYIRGMCQRPDQFVQLARVMYTMWGGEDMGRLLPPEAM